MEEKAGSAGVATSSQCPSPSMCLREGIYGEGSRLRGCGASLNLGGDKDGFRTAPTRQSAPHYRPSLEPHGSECAHIRLRNLIIFCRSGLCPSRSAVLSASLPLHLPLPASSHQPRFQLPPDSTCITTSPSLCNNRIHLIQRVCVSPVPSSLPSTYPLPCSTSPRSISSRRLSTATLGLCYDTRLWRSPSLQRI
jgi:hypothetical protein